MTEYHEIVHLVKGYALEMILETSENRNILRTQYKTITMNIYGHTESSPTMSAFLNSSVNIYLLPGREVNTEGSEIRLPVFKCYLLFFSYGTRTSLLITLNLSFLTHN